MANTCSVVLRPEWYADCASGIRILRRSQHLRMRQMDRIFLIIESKTIGRRFAGGPCFLPGFGRGVSIPDLISAGYLPVLAMMFSSCVFLVVHTLYILHLVRLPLRSFGCSCFWMPFRVIRL